MIPQSNIGITDPMKICLVGLCDLLNDGRVHRAFTREQRDIYQAE